MLQSVAVIFIDLRNLLLTIPRVYFSVHLGDAAVRILQKEAVESRTRLVLNVYRFD